ncbi:MAG: FAD-dependent oxidoreductase [Firmicutes bacterium]|nr:FAD-dependent oxidoreductase [Bacillota bacterium]
MLFDTIIIGGGLLGCFCAMNLSRFPLKTALLEMREDICTGISRANTAVIYPGYDNKAHSMKATMSLRANQNFADLCRDLCVPFNRCGSLLAACGPISEQTLLEKYEQGMANGVPGLRLLTPDQARELEPGLSSDITSVLYAPSTGTVHPWELCIAAFETARDQGCEMHLNSKVTAIQKTEEGFLITVNDSEIFRCRSIVNCAGIHADQVQRLIAPPTVCIRAELAEYLVYDPDIQAPLKHIIFQETEHQGKGVTLIPTISGKVLVGTTKSVTDADSPHTTTQSHKEYLRESGQTIFPALKNYSLIRTFSGHRPNPVNPDQTTSNLHGFPDLITETPTGFISLTAIKTPGLTCVDEIGKYITDRILSSLHQEDLEPTIEVSRRKISRHQNPETYHRIICRCENISEGDILDAIDRGATTIDGIKRRTGSGLGICQGGHCASQIAEILAERLQISLEGVTKDGKDSYYLHS